MPKPLLRKLLILWAMLLIGQFLLAAAVTYQNMKAGLPFMRAALTMEPVLALASLLLFLLTYFQYRNRP